jgi:hypothetical protein
MVSIGRRDARDPDRVVGARRTPRVHAAWRVTTGYAALCGLFISSHDVDMGGVLRPLDATHGEPSCKRCRTILRRGGG